MFPSVITLPFTTLIISGLFKIYCIIKLHPCLFFLDSINHITLFYSQLLHWASSNSAFESKSENSDPQLLPLLFLFELNQTRNFLRKICSNYIFPNTKRTRCNCLLRLMYFLVILFLSWYPLFAFVCLVVWLLFVFASFFLFFSCIVKSESPIKIKVTLKWHIARICLDYSRLFRPHYVILFLIQSCNSYGDKKFKNTSIKLLSCRTVLLHSTGVKGGTLVWNAIGGSG